MVDTKSQAGRDFVLFKRQLYKLYEVQSRSVWEHEEFSFKVERRNLRWLFDASKDYTQEMDRINYFENMADHGSLKGKVFKMKLMTPARLKGLTAFGATAYAYSNLTALAMMLGPIIPMIGLTAGTVYGML